MAHSFDTKAQITGSGSPVAANYTCGAGATVLVLGIVVAGTTARAGGAPTYNGVAMVQAGILKTAAETNCELWYMLAPPTGSALSISIPNTGSRSLYCCASSYISATGASAIDCERSAAGGSANPSQLFYPTINGDVAVVVCGYGLDTAPTGRTHTTLYETDNGTFSDNHQYALIADTSATTVGWTVDASDSTLVLAAFREETSPHIAIQPATADTYIASDATDTNYDTNAALLVRSLSGVVKSALLSFDFSASISVGATITSATLSLFSDNSVTAAGVTIYCYRLRRTDWVSAEATYNHYKGTTDWGTAGALHADTDYDTTDAANSLTVAGANWQNWNVTAQVQSALDTYSGIAHFKIVANTVGGSTSSYRSSNYATANLRPKLYIEYILPVTDTSINIGDVRKAIDWTGSKINVGDAWKNITKVQINIGDVWKDVYIP
jgi:hypothetical protein